jgi:hypothetical protein
MLANALIHNALSVPRHQRTDEERVTMSADRQTNDWGERAVYWLRSRYVNWPIKAIARDLDEPESVVKSWWMGGRPSREKLQKMSRRYPEMHSFVFGRPSTEELRSRLDALNNNLSELRGLLNEVDQRSAGPPMRVVGRATRTSG